MKPKLNILIRYDKIIMMSFLEENASRKPLLMVSKALEDIAFGR